MNSPTNELAERRRYRPPIGIPTPGEPTAQATAASVLLHLLIVVLIVAPTLFVSAQLVEITQQGGGGPGPAGGGGGGNRGNRGGNLPFIRERLDKMSLATPAPPEIKKPEEKKPEEVKIPLPLPPEVPKPEPPVAPAAATVIDSAALLAASKAGGTGTDGTNGSGPGSGGGTGSGIGPGRGSSTGPGTGGGDGVVYPPTVVALPILPLPIPSRVRPYRMVAQFEVDTLGNATLIGFNPSRDAGYNRRIKEMLLEIRFRPAVRPDGRPVRALAVVTAEAL